jgi:NTP pyrophosphatase (non-canonical NTP hydrolase)
MYFPFLLFARADPPDARVQRRRRQNMSEKTVLDTLEEALQLAQDLQTENAQLKKQLEVTKEAAGKMAELGVMATEKAMALYRQKAQQFRDLEAVWRRTAMRNKTLRIALERIKQVDGPGLDGSPPGVCHLLADDALGYSRPVQQPSLNFEELRAANASRCERFHPPGSIPWNIAEWNNALCGEAGEAANVAKKIRRQETGAANAGDEPLEVLKEKYVKELADTVIYADLCAKAVGADLGEAVRGKFNEVSERQGFPERL